VFLTHLSKRSKKKGNIRGKKAAKADKIVSESQKTLM